MDKKIELLAPAGSYEKAVIAYIYGADAVYVGTPNVSLRSRAKVDDDDLDRIIKYAKEHGKKVYSAVNIYAEDDDYSEIIKQVKYLAKVGVDGIIVSDGGVLEIVKEYAPNIPINISTQANTLSLRACNFWYKNGAKRIIMAREIKKENLKKIMENKPDDLEIEVFVHGAICFAYSGRCYLSNYLADRNANKGDCVQSCRWNYNIYVEDRNNEGDLMEVSEDENGMTIFSSKDLCLIDELGDLIDIGVDSLKIEGRLKTEYYLASIISIYRQAIDEYLEKGTYDVSKYMKEIEKVKTRDLTKFNFDEENIKNSNDITTNQTLNGRQYNNNYQYAGITDCMVLDGFAKIYIKNKLNVGDELELLVPNVLEPVTFKIEKLIDVETGEELDTINPGVKDQQVIMNVPQDVSKYYIFRKRIGKKI